MPDPWEKLVDARALAKRGRKHLRALEMDVDRIHRPIRHHHPARHPPRLVDDPGPIHVSACERNVWKRSRVDRNFRQRKTIPPSHEITPASFQRPMSSHPNPASSNISSVCSPASGARERTAKGSPSNCTGLEQTLVLLPCPSS